MDVGSIERAFLQFEIIGLHAHGKSERGNDSVIASEASRDGKLPRREPSVSGQLAGVFYFLCVDEKSSAHISSKSRSNNIGWTSCCCSNRPNSSGGNSTAIYNAFPHVRQHVR